MKPSGAWFLERTWSGKLGVQAREASRRPGDRRARPPPRHAPYLVGPSWLPRPTSFVYMFPYTLKTSNTKIDREFRRPVGSPFRHPIGGGIPHRWPSSSSRHSPWRGGSSSPSGMRVCTNSYVFDLSLSCSLYGTILMYRELCYYSWILWWFFPLYSLVKNWVLLLKLSYRIESLRIWEHLMYVLHVLIYGDNGIFTWSTWCMFWWSTCGFRNIVNLCIGVGTRFVLTLR